MAGARTERERTAGTQDAAEVLVGVLFASAKELRHQAEQLLGRLFVPVEVHDTGENAAELVLRPEGMGEVRVHARRERHWHPFRITRVETVAR